TTSHLHHLSLTTLTLLHLPRHPPHPTLFPYTTLFRSIFQPLIITQQPIYDPPSRSDDLHRQQNDRVQKPPKFHPYQFQAPLPLRDRKSTRLNSSHLGISYAVFCLKKKTYNCQTYS